jgi:hypothetical protein
MPVRLIFSCRMLTFSVRKPPTVQSGTCKYPRTTWKTIIVYVLWRDPLGLELGHRGCGQGELYDQFFALLPLDFDVNRVHVQLDHELGVNRELDAG